MKKILLVGFTGKVGRILLKKNFDNIFIRYLINSKNKFMIYRYIEKSDLVIDFSISYFSKKILNLCFINKRRLIIGTTGISSSNSKLFKLYSKKIPIFFEYNLNVSFEYFRSILKYSNKKIKNMDKILFETHNKDKIDSPSGSSYKIFNSIKEKIKYYSIRYGSCFGKHSVIFYDNYNTITIKHNVINNNYIFKSIKKAILFIFKKNNGFYNIKNII